MKSSIRPIDSASCHLPGLHRTAQDNYTSTVKAGRNYNNPTLPTREPRPQLRLHGPRHPVTCRFSYALGQYSSHKFTAQFFSFSRDFELRLEDSCAQDVRRWVQHRLRELRLGCGQAWRAGRPLGLFQGVWPVITCEILFSNIVPLVTISSPYAQFAHFIHYIWSIYIQEEVIFTTSLPIGNII